MLYRLVSFNFCQLRCLLAWKIVIVLCLLAGLSIHPLYVCVSVCFLSYICAILLCHERLYASKWQVPLLMFFFITLHSICDRLCILKWGRAWHCVLLSVRCHGSVPDHRYHCLTTRFSLIDSPQQLPPVAMHSLYGFYALRADWSIELFHTMLQLCNFPVYHR